MNNTQERTDLATRINNIDYTLLEVNERQQKEIVRGLALMPESITERIYNNYHLTGHNLTIQQLGMGEYGIFDGVKCPLYIMRN